MAKIKLLLISLYYPPLASIASHRLESFTKYLDPSKFNIDVITLTQPHTQTVQEERNVTIYRVANKTVFKRFSFDTKVHPLVHKAKALWNLLYSYFGDEHKGWKSSASTLAQQLHQTKQYDLVLSSYAPVASHEVVLSLKKYDPQLTWIADMRDEMSKNPFLTQKQRQQLSVVEQDIFANTQAITSVSSPILNDFRSLAKEKSQNISFCEIRNGYDFELKELTTPSTKFTISYIGSFYGDITPDTFLEALEKVICKHASVDIEVKFIGVKKPLKVSDTLKSTIDFIPPVSHEKAIDYMHQSDALLLIHPTNRRKGVYTGKLFEYMAVLKPIIALVDEQDVAAQLIQKAHSGYVSDSNDIKKIEKNILEAYRIWEEGTHLQPDIQIIKKHHRKEQAKRLQNLIFTLLTERDNG